MGPVGAAKEVNNFPGWPLPSCYPPQFCTRAPLVLGSCRTVDRVFSACTAEGSKELCVMTQSSKIAMCLIESLAHSDRRAIAHSSPINGQGRGSGCSARQYLACLVSLPHSSFLFKIYFQNDKFQKIMLRGSDFNTQQKVICIHYWPGYFLSAKVTRRNLQSQALSFLVVHKKIPYSISV